MTWHELMTETGLGSNLMLIGALVGVVLWCAPWRER